MPAPFRFLSHLLKQHAASFYVAGAKLEDALRVCRGWEAGSTTICAWNKDNTVPGENAQRCVAGIDAVHAAQMDGRVAFKPHDLQFSHDLIGNVLDHARTCKVPLHFDSMGPETAEPSLALIDALHRRSDALGITIPARWRRSTGDADRAIARGLNVRVVKGQWPDPDEPKLNISNGFLAVIGRLAGRARHVSVATHDPLLARAALEMLCHTQTSCELELLFGLPMHHMMLLARDLGVPVRLYVPYGHAWLPYALGQVRRKPQVAWWILRDAFFRKRLENASLHSSRSKVTLSSHQQQSSDCG